jgi:hypothetical protein
MNSDFVQLESETLYKRVAAEPDNRARIRKLYNFVYGRDPKEAEILLGLDYLKTEPAKEYEESKQRELEKEKEKEKAKSKGDKTKDKEAKPAGPEIETKAATVEGSGMPVAPLITADAKPAMPKTNIAEAEPDMPMPDAAAMPADPNADMGMGMMAGVPGRRGGPAKPVEIKYEPTVWGRYAKMLLSSSEFIFIN